MADQTKENVHSSTRSAQGAEVGGNQGRGGAAGQDFARQAAEAPRGIVLEYWDFLRSNKRWWLTPIVIALLLIGVFVLLSATAAAPFIYTLF